MLTAIKCFMLKRKARNSRERADYCRAVADHAMADAAAHEEDAIRAKLEVRRLCAKSNIDLAFNKAGRDIHVRAQQSGV